MPPLGMMASFQHEVEEIPIGSGDMILVLSGAPGDSSGGQSIHCRTYRALRPERWWKRFSKPLGGAQEVSPDGPTVLFLRRH